MHERSHARVRQFEKFVRIDFKMPEETLDNEKLLGLWSSIDNNQNGFICAGEFCRFMRAACEGMNKSETLEQNVAAEIQEKVSKQRTFNEIKREETWARHTASKSVHNAKEMDAEAKRIERLLADFESLRAPFSEESTNGPSKSTSRRLPGSRKANWPADGADVSDSGSPVRKAYAASSPSAVRASALQMLSREVNRPTGQGQAKKAGSSFLLPTIKREECQL